MDYITRIQAYDLVRLRLGVSIETLPRDSRAKWDSLLEALHDMSRQLEWHALQEALQKI